MGFDATDASSSVLVDKLRALGLNHDVLKVLTIIDGVVVNETPLRIGKGRGELSEVDLPVIRDFRGVPYIPGSSIKGCARALVEAVARASGYNVCDAINNSLCSFRAELLNKVFQIALTTTSLDEIKKRIEESKDEFVKLASRRKINKSIVEEFLSTANSDLISALEKNAPCIICRLFGNQALASKLIFFDAYPINEHEVRTAIRTRVAIDRFREAARSGALFEYEFIPPGYEWRFRVEAKNVDVVDCNSDECKLLRAFIKMFATHGLLCGGMKSVGHGLLKVVPEKTRVIVYKIKEFSLVEDKNITLEELVKRW